MRRLSLALALPLAACGGGDSTAPPTDGAPASVTVAFPSPTLALGDSARATATVRDARGTLLGAATVTWRSSAPNVLAVNPATGMTRALALDTASVIATAATATGSAAVRVRAPARATVTMLPFAFVPFSTVVAVGGTVTYDFSGGADHNVIFERRTGAPVDIGPRSAGTVDRTFPTAGTFPYECRIHPGMIGEVTVVP